MYAAKNRGFTLVELMVVIAIIGILASIVLASLGGAKGKARDSRRIADIKSIQLALSLYYNDNLMYPKNIYAASSISGQSAPVTGLAGGYLAVVPIDPSYNTAIDCAAAPSTAGCYRYQALTSGASGACNNTDKIPNTYHLGAILEESTNSALVNDVDQSSFNPAGQFAGYIACTLAGSGGFNGITNNCGGTNTNSTDQCYDQKP